MLCLLKWGFYPGVIFNGLQLLMTLIVFLHYASFDDFCLKVVVSETGFNIVKKYFKTAFWSLLDWVLHYTGIVRKQCCIVLAEKFVFIITPLENSV